ncbi:MAG: type III pantothenate kinase [Nitrospirae bacterium]|nr:MAG: type III pantothenate kinase [Nitrospirota bacterium]
MRNLLCIDIGNSTIGFALFVNPLHSKSIIDKIPTHPAKGPEYYKKIITAIMKRHEQAINNTAVIVSSVVPALNAPVLKSLSLLRISKPLIVTHRTNTGLRIETISRLKLGADRIVNAVAGFAITKKPCAVADFGTATTITIVGRNRNIVGGAILPGIGLMADSLANGTAKLPQINKTKPVKALGKETRTALLSGIIYGSAGAVETIVRKIEKELGFKLQLMTTGGNGRMMSDVINRKCTYVDDLIFQGLRRIYLKNTDNPGRLTY